MSSDPDETGQSRTAQLVEIPRPSGRSLTCTAVERLSVTEYAQKVTVECDVEIRRKTVGFLQKAYGFSLLMTFTIIFFQGFNVGGFKLSDSFLQWLGVATVGQVAGLFAMAIRKPRK
jgi:hypothetical protein